MFNTRTAWGRLLLLDPGRGEGKLRESSGSTTARWWSLWFSCRASPSTTKEEEVFEEGEGCAREEVRLPSHPSTIYRRKGRGGGALGFPLGGGGQADWISLGKILGRLAPQAKQVEACLPSQVEAPHLPK